MLTLNRWRYGTGVEPEPAPLRPLVGEPIPDSATMPTTAQTWPTGPVLHQGRLGACGAFATVAELIADPHSDRTLDPAVGNEYGVDHYQRARTLDGQPPMPDGTGYTGSKVSRCMEVNVERGFASDYRRLSSVEEVAQAIVDDGPVVLVVRWLRSFEQTEGNGLMVYRPTDPDRGFHAILAHGYDPARSLPGETRRWWKSVTRRRKNRRGRTVRRRVRVRRTTRTPDLAAEPMLAIRNSWGTSWGTKDGRKRKGDGWLRVRDLRHLWDAGHAYAYAPVDRQPVDLAAWLAQQPTT